MCVCGCVWVCVWVCGCVWVGGCGWVGVGVGVWVCVGVLTHCDAQCLFQIMALGNQVGRIFVWDLDVEDPAQTKSVVFLL